MSSRADPRLWLLLASRASLAAMLSASGCYASHLCGDPESCNGRDDDCDGLVDEECAAAACAADSDCDDGDPATRDACVAGVCTHG